MKKILTILAALLVVVGASAQSSKHAIGVRGGYAGQFLYQYHMSDANYFELAVGYACDQAGIQGTYNWNVKQWHWTPGLWQLTTGVGANIGYGWDDYRLTDHDITARYPLLGFAFSAVGSVGLNYTFANFPLTLGFDYSPMLGVCVGDKWKDNVSFESKTGASFMTNGLFNFAISAVWRF